MPSFSGKSKSRLSQCDIRLQKVFNEVIKHFDCSITCGYRNKEDQDSAYAKKTSSKKFPNSKHNVYPSIAIDVAPYPIDWDDLDRFRYFVGYVMGTAKQMGYTLRSGLDWDGDTDLRDQNLIDMPHFEIMN